MLVDPAKAGAHSRNDTHPCRWAAAVSPSRILTGSAGALRDCLAERVR